MENNKGKEAKHFSFDDPRLSMTVAGRLVVRVITWVTYLVFFAATITFLISNIPRVRVLGIFLGLVLLDLFIHRGEGDVPISELRSVKEINVAKSMRPSAFLVLERGFDAGIVARRDFLVEMMERLIEFPEIDEGLRRLDVPISEFKEKLADAAGEKTVASSTDPMIASTSGVVAMNARAMRDEYLKDARLLAITAFGEAVNAGHEFIEVSDLFSAIAKLGNANIDRLFDLFAIESGDLERALIFTINARSRAIGRLPAMIGGFVLDSHRQIRHRIMNRAWTSRPTPTLDHYGSDLTDLAREGEIGFLIGHEEEYERLVETLARPTNPNALLVGEAGIGKDALVQHLAFRLAKDDVPHSLFDKRLVSLEIQSLVAGAAQDELGARLKKIVDEIYLAGNIIVYIPDIHNLVRTSGTAYLSAADALMPVITNNVFPIVGTSFPKEYKQLIEPRSDFTSAFEVIQVAELSEPDTEKLLTYEAVILERQSGVIISFGAVKKAVILAKKYFHDKFLPSSAEELLKSAVIEAEHRGEKSLTPDIVIKVAEIKTKIPIHEAGVAESAKLLNLEALIHERLIGQDEGVKAIATALREYRSGLARKGGPIASFLFVGPTGVGKTELAKILADIQFGSEKLMTRFDMTEYQDKASFARFIGSADGQTRGTLTEAVRERPYSLILLDEFEKAYPDILDLFLQVLDDGRLTDALGRVVDFTNTIIIATSNAHSDIINEALAKGESMTDISEYLRKRLVDVFKPELINRFSKIIIFRNLEPRELSQIVTLNLAELAAAVKAQGIFLDFDPSAVSQIAKLGYDPAFGARPLRRVIEEQVRAPLAEAILGKKIIKGARIKLVYKEEKFEFE